MEPSEVEDPIETLVYRDLDRVLAALKAFGVNYAKFGAIELRLSAAPDPKADPKFPNGKPETPLDRLFPHGKPEFR